MTKLIILHVYVLNSALFSEGTLLVNYTIKQTKLLEGFSRLGSICRGELDKLVLTQNVFCRFPSIDLCICIL